MTPNVKFIIRVSFGEGGGGGGGALLPLPSFGLPPFVYAENSILYMKINNIKALMTQ